MALPIAQISVDVRGIPELVWSCRHEMAKLLRREAEIEVSSLVKKKLEEVANRFEAGQ